MISHQFDLNRGMISQYVRMIATPKLETIQKICALRYYY
jgi:hypothetical protein